MKKVTFDEEELLVISVFTPDTRTNTLLRMKEVIPELQDDAEMDELVVSASEKLKQISDREFEELGLDAYRKEQEGDT